MTTKPALSAIWRSSDKESVIIQSHPLYDVWQGMKQRCFNPNHPGYRHWGGRGITVCERWLSFANFTADMGERPEGTSLDRKNNDGDYEPGNCRWATDKVQQTNRRDSWRNKLRRLKEKYGL